MLPASLSYGRAACLCLRPLRGIWVAAPEAMAEGIPVVASNAASLPEIWGDAALFVAPDDVEGLARAMRTILSNPALAQQLRKAGRKRAAQFTWRHVPRHTSLCMNH